MPAYKVAHNYSAVYRSHPIAFDEGASVEVDDDVAEWVNRDSPGCLVVAKAAKAAPVEDAPADEPETASKPKRGRRAGA